MNTYILTTLLTAIEIDLPPGFPEKYRNAIIKTAGLCSVKKVIMDPPEFEITARTT
jgi:ribosomal protein S12 methylthiotransferase accessory factor